MTSVIVEFHYYRNPSDGQQVGPFSDVDPARRLFERGGWEHQAVQVVVPEPDWDRKDATAQAFVEQLLAADDGPESDAE